MKYDTELYNHFTDTLHNFIEYVCNSDEATDTSRNVFCHLAILSEVIDINSMKTSDLIGRCINLISVGSKLMGQLDKSFYQSEMFKMCIDTIHELSVSIQADKFTASYWLSQAEGK